MLQRHVRRGIRIAVYRDLSLAAVLFACFAIGIALATAIFGVVRAVLLVPLPYSSPESVVMIWGSKSLNARRGISVPDLSDIRTRSKSLEDMAILAGEETLSLDTQFESSPITAARVDARFFPMLGSVMLLGHAPDAGTWTLGTDAVISAGLWKERFGARDVIGQRVRIGSRAYAIAAVAPVAFGVSGTYVDAWIPLDSTISHAGSRGQPVAQAVCRLKPDIQSREAQAELDAIATALRLEYVPIDRQLTVGVFSLSDVVLGQYRNALWFLLLGILGVFALACLSLANALVARCVSRRGEFAVRSALGASPLQLQLQMLSEVAPLSAIAAGFGLWLSFVVLNWVRSLPIPDVPRIQQAILAPSVLWFGCILTVCGIAVCTLLPTVWIRRLAKSHDLHRAEHWDYSLARRSLEVVTAVQACSGVAFLYVGLLFITSFVRVAKVDWGLDASRVAVISVKVEPPLKAAAQLDAISRTLTAISGSSYVAKAAWSSGVPGGRSWTFRNTRLAVNGRLATTGWTATGWYMTRDFFSVLRAKPVRGTSFIPEIGDGERTAVVNSELAEKVWPGEDPVGKTVDILRPSQKLRAWMSEHSSLLSDEVARDPGSWEPDGAPLRIAGVVDVRMFPVHLPSEPAIFLDIQHFESLSTVGTYHFLIETVVEPSIAIPELAQRIFAVDGRFHPLQAGSLEEVRIRAAGVGAAAKFLGYIASSFAVLGLVLLATALYSIADKLARQQTRDFAIRIMLGADPARIRRAVLLRLGVITCAGVACGVFIALAVGRALEHLLVLTTTNDLFLLTVAALTTITSAILAAYVPLRSISLIDSAKLLRQA
jgi:putative ABC transport system permease protein